MNKPTLVVMAAGMGSRYGGLKQIDPIGPNGELILDYSIYDAIHAGFEKVIFIIKEENLALFEQTIGDRIKGHIIVEYAFQSTADVPQQYKQIATERQKPWGTAHAVMSCRGMIDTNFAVINSDDFYGCSAFEQLAHYLTTASDRNGMYDFCMMGFVLENTLTENGHVARGVCQTDANGNLVDITERTKIKKFGDETKYTEDEETWITLPKGSIVSMNMWGFTPGILDEIVAGFPSFLEQAKSNPQKAEYFLPAVVDRLIKQHKAVTKVLSCNERWYGVTYKEDKPMVQQAIRQMIADGIYPQTLWT